jgi:hypothetical protein
MSEQKSEKKVVSRTVAIALGIITIVLAVGLVGAMADYTSMINGKDNTISSQASQISNLQNRVNGITSNLTDTLELQKSETWLNDQAVSISSSGSTSWTFSASYAGYVYVLFDTKAENFFGLYIRTSFHYADINYYNQVGNSTYASNIADFPILPSNVQIVVGTTSTNGISGNVTIIYFY